MILTFLIDVQFHFGIFYKHKQKKKQKHKDKYEYKFNYWTKKKKIKSSCMNAEFEMHLSM